MQNFIHVYQNAYSQEYCDEVIQFFEYANAAGFGKTRQQLEKIPKHLKEDVTVSLPSLRFAGDSQDLLNNFLNPFINKFYQNYVESYSTLANILQQTVYGLRVQKTNPGGGYHEWHFENGGRQFCARIAVFSLYLNTIEEGGETEFLYYGLRVKPEQGTLVIWPAGFTHTHRGNPPLKETKYLLTGWVEVG